MEGMGMEEHVLGIISTFVRHLNYIGKGSNILTPLSRYKYD